MTIASSYYRSVGISKNGSNYSDSRRDVLLLYFSSDFTHAYCLFTRAVGGVDGALRATDLDDFLACYNPRNRHERKESERFKSLSYEELTKRDKHSITLSNVPGFPRHTRRLGASRRRAGALPALTSTSSG